MSYEIHLTKEIMNEIGRKVVTVENITVNDGYILVGNYLVPLNNIKFIKNVD